MELTVIYTKEDKYLYRNGEDCERMRSYKKARRNSR